MRHGEDWSVDMVDRGVFIEEDIVTGTAARSDDVKVRGVGVSKEDHVSYMVDNAVVGLGSGVVEDLGDVVIGKFGYRGLSGANFVESSK